MYSISIFYFTFYLFGGCVRTQRTPLPPLLSTGLYNLVQQQQQQQQPRRWGGGGGGNVVIVSTASR